MPSMTPSQIMHRISPCVRWVHYYQTNQNFAIYPRPRVLFLHLLLYIKSGQGTISIGEESYHVTPESLFYIRPGIEHTMEGMPDSTLLMYNIHFNLIEDDLHATTPICYPSMEETQQHLELCDVDPMNDPIYFLPARITHFVSAIYEKYFFDILKHSPHPGLSQQLSVKAAMINLLSHLYRYQAYAVESGMSPLTVEQIEAIIPFIEQHLGDQLTLEQLAEQCAMSIPHFTRCFRKIYQISPIRYLQGQRIERAKYLLIHSTLPIKEIAHTVGYESVHYFTRAFKHHIGLPPAFFRRNSLSCE